ncbi:helix-turn-helix domain-containing protein [Rubrobacter tropicus]|uniref:hypothetical protein n=1 Tax=Rubrobacter tropicus TaxID=2653851 RepID=UPI00140A5064|nr:hypothetical protein [Rubrobacter tropicus]
MQTALEPNIIVIGQAGTFAEARGPPGDADLAIVGLQLPEGNGIGLISEPVEGLPAC